MPAATERDEAGLVGICVLAAVCAAAVGFIGSAFRWLLEQAERWRIDLAGWTRDHGWWGWLVPVVVTAVGAAAARWLVVRSPHAAGSGIQEVEGMWAGEIPAPPLSVLPVKFVGGVLALGSGMVLGREGPTVHMGAVVGAEAMRRLRLPALDGRVLQVALAGAGLAVAFNAPLGGALFVFEEVTRSFRPRLVMTTLIACAVAVGCSRVLLGDHPDFIVVAQPTPSITQLWAFLALGLVLGVIGAGYNALVMSFLGVTDRMTAVDPVVRAAVIGALVGAALVIDPFAVGGGDRLSQDLLSGGHLAVWSIVGYLGIRFVTGPLSYAAGVPGGLFAPLLALGALTGGAVAPALERIVPGLEGHGASIVIVGMAAIFAASVRAPLTGIALIVEMTGAANLTVALLVACFAATLTPTLLRSAPIYDSLKARTLHRNAQPSSRRGT